MKRCCRTHDMSTRRFKESRRGGPAAGFTETIFFSLPISVLAISVYTFEDAKVAESQSLFANPAHRHCGCRAALADRGAIGDSVPLARRSRRQNQSRGA